MLDERVRLLANSPAFVVYWALQVCAGWSEDAAWRATTQVVGLICASLLTERIGLLRVLDGSVALYPVAGIAAFVWFRKLGAAQAPADAPHAAHLPIEAKGGGNTGANHGS